MLVGRPCGELPASLPDIAPDLPRELASAVMGCLERSPQWRPKDLTYLAQLAAAQQKAMRRGSEPDTGSAPQPVRGASAQRLPPKRPSRSHLPLLTAALLVVGAAALSFWWIQRQGPDGPRWRCRARAGQRHARTRPDTDAHTDGDAHGRAVARRVPGGETCGPGLDTHRAPGAESDTHADTPADAYADTAATPTPTPVPVPPVVAAVARPRPPRSPRRNPPSRPCSPRSLPCRSAGPAGPCSTCEAPGSGPTCAPGSCPCARRRAGYPWPGRSG